MPTARSDDGVGIHWQEHGSGPPLLLIMGLGYTSEMWHRVVPTLRERYRTIVFDNRGVGRSEVPEGPYPVPTMAEDARAVLDAADVASAHVFGMSMGGFVAQELALAHPERVRTLVLGCTACGGAEAVAPEPEVLARLAARFELGAEEGGRAMVPYIYGSETPSERIDEDLAIRLRTFPSAAAYVAQLQGVGGWSSYARLGRLRVPTLVLQGEEDRLVPPGNAAVLADAIPGARAVMLERASHLFFTDRTERALEVLLEFLAQHDG